MTCEMAWKNIVEMFKEYSRQCFGEWYRESEWECFE
jgi:hypothetical protein